MDQREEKAEFLQVEILFYFSRGGSGFCSGDLAEGGRVAGKESDQKDRGGGRGQLPIQDPLLHRGRNAKQAD